MSHIIEVLIKKSAKKDGRKEGGLGGIKVVLVSVNDRPTPVHTVLGLQNYT